MNNVVICPDGNCNDFTDSSCVFYEGEALQYAGINTNDSLQVIVQKLEVAIRASNMMRDAHFKYEQGLASNIWNITHDLGKFPSVTIVDSAGDEMWAAITHTDNNNLRIEFIGATSGKAYLN